MSIEFVLPTDTMIKKRVEDRPDSYRPLVSINHFIGIYFVHFCVWPMSKCYFDLLCPLCRIGFPFSFIAVHVYIISTHTDKLAVIWPLPMTYTGWLITIKWQLTLKPKSIKSNCLNSDDGPKKSRRRKIPNNDGDADNVDAMAHITPACHGRKISSTHLNNGHTFFFFFEIQRRKIKFITLSMQLT